MKHVLALTILVMIAFAANSILVRLALLNELIDPMSFSIVRILAGAAALAIIAGPKRTLRSGSWKGAVYLLLYLSLIHI